MQAGVGVVLIVGMAFLVTDREDQGLRLSFFALLLYLSVVNLLLFYYNQFSTIITAADPVRPAVGSAVLPPSIY